MKKRRYLISGLVVALSSFALIACNQEGDLKFNHAIHVVDNGAACADCHTVGKNDKMGSPSMDKCKECHEIDLDKPSEACLKCHSVKSAKKDYAVTAKEAANYKDVIFSHAVHDGVVECDGCHKDAGKSKSLEGLVLPKMTDCYSCHDGSTAPNECEKCHQVYRKDKAPESHHMNWDVKHGKESRFSNTCSYCHENQQRFCVDCHKTQMPKDHIANWKTTQHGVEATHDRRLCATCHSTGYCTDCHRSEKPITHKMGNWMAMTRENGHAEEAVRNFRSCNVCHSTDDCMKCHRNIILRQK